MKDPLQNVLDKVNGVYKQPAFSATACVEMPEAFARVGHFNKLVLNPEHVQADTYGLGDKLWTYTDMQNYAVRYHVAFKQKAQEVPAKFPVPVASLHDDGYYISNKSHPMARMHKINMSVFTATDVEAYARDYAASLPKPDVSKLRSAINELIYANAQYVQDRCSHRYLLGKQATLDAILKEFE